MSVHAEDCEKAEPGSLCDCDCAGAKHAIGRTKGGVSAAGSVSRRAQKIAAKDGRAAVVNRLAEPADNDAGPRRRRKPGDPPAGRPGETLSAAKPLLLSPRTATLLRDTRQQLPRTPAGWQAAAGQSPDEAVPAARAQLAAADAKVAAAEAAIEALYDEHAKKEARRLARDKKGGWANASRADRESAARAVAPHRAWEDPRYDELTAAKSDAQSEQFRAKNMVEQIDRAIASGQWAQAAPYPVDEATGYRMPTARLNEHLDQVTALGRQVLAEARQAADQHPPRDVVAARATIAAHDAASDAVAAVLLRRDRAGDLLSTRNRGDAFTVQLPDEGAVQVTSYDQWRALRRKYQAKVDDGAAEYADARRVEAGHQAAVLRKLLGDNRPGGFGGATHTDVHAWRDTVTEGGDTDNTYGVTNPRTDWRERLTLAEQHFPTDWVAASARTPLTVGASRRAYCSGPHLSMPATDHQLTGALSYVDEVNVHELGHRMEETIAGLTHLEFAYVRRRGRLDDGSVQPTEQIYNDKPHEVGQPDKWANAYAGKTYEDRNRAKPGEQSWEVFQVGLQDTFGRSTTTYGPTDDPDELQAFVIGALLTLG